MSSSLIFRRRADGALSSVAAGLAIAFAVTGCAGETEPAPSQGDDTEVPLPQQQGGAAAASGTWCEVQAIMNKSCTSCHDGEGTAGSPMGLTEHTDMLADAPISQGKKVYEAVGARMHDVARPMPPRGLLPASELKIIDDWIAAGAPGPESCDAPPAPPPPEEPGLSAEDCDEVYELRAQGATPDSPYVVPAGAEIHPQIRLDAPWGNERVQAINFRPITDNGKVLHHWILYAGMGMLTGWAPGDDEELPYPSDVGMDMPTGRGSLRLDMHYYNTTGAKAEPDRSGVAVCIVKGSKLRKNSAAVAMNFSAFQAVLAPANTRGHKTTGSCTISGTQPVHLLTASPHAHRYAKHMRFSVKKRSGQEIVMHDHPFQFGEQGTYPLDPPVVLESGDVVTTTCVYDNDTNRNVRFGESTDDEMCFNFALYYPKGALRCGGGLGGRFGR